MGTMEKLANTDYYDLILNVSYPAPHFVLSAQYEAETNQFLVMDPTINNVEGLLYSAEDVLGALVFVNSFKFSDSSDIFSTISIDDLSASNVESCNFQNKVPKVYMMNDTKWSNTEIGQTEVTIGTNGSFLCSLSSMMAQENITYEGQLINPESLNNWMMNEGIQNGELYLNRIPGFQYVGKAGSSKQVLKAASNGEYVIGIMDGFTPYFVLIYGSDGEVVAAMDPTQGIQIYAATDFTAGYIFEPSEKSSSSSSSSSSSKSSSSKSDSKDSDSTDDDSDDASGDDDGDDSDFFSLSDLSDDWLDDGADVAGTDVLVDVGDDAADDIADEVFGDALDDLGDLLLTLLAFILL